jgi:DNA-binding Lrp family transcriptional regulator
VRERVAALELGGFLMGYEARVDWDQAGLPMLAVVHASCNMERLADVAKQLAAIPNVTRALLLTGPKPVFVMLRIRDMAHLHRILRDNLAPGDLQQMEVQVTLESLVDRRPPEMPQTGESSQMSPA